MSSDVFLNAAKLVDDSPTLTSCMAIYERVGGHGWSNAAFMYRRMFRPDQQHGWWNGRGPEAQRARIYALLLAHAMHLTGDI